MFLHIGSDYVIPLKNIVAITDMTAIKSGINEKFITTKRKEKKVEDVSDGNAKSFIITDNKVYLSAISSITLKKRAGYIKSESHEDREEE